VYNLAAKTRYGYSGGTTTPLLPERAMPQNLTDVICQPDEEFRFALESINSAFGISADTLKAIANSYGVPVERIIIRAVTLWAKVEIPGLDLEEPLLSDDQLEALRLRRVRIDQDRENKQNRPSLLEQFKEHLQANREQDDAQYAEPEARNQKSD
jgi:hypothetical protein